MTDATQPVLSARIGLCPPRRRVLLGAALAALAQAGCASRGVGRSEPGNARDEGRTRWQQWPLPAALASADVIVLGEVHDNAAQHRLRAQWLQQLAARRRLALVMEQFDVPAQTELDAGRAARDDPDALARRAHFSFEGWQWPLYRPYVELALRDDLPLLAANLPARQVMAVARGAAPSPALLTGDPWTASQQEAMATAISDGHCGMLPPAAVPAMVTAQRARDAGMAEVIVQARQRLGLPVVLLAGNGHARNDVGVPHYLRRRLPQARIVSVGLLEQSQSNPGNDPSPESGSDAGYDIVIRTAAQSRDDPCEAMRKPGAGASS